MKQKAQLINVCKQQRNQTGRVLQNLGDTGLQPNGLFRRIIHAATLEKKLRIKFKQDAQLQLNN